MYKQKKLSAPFFSDPLLVLVTTTLVLFGILMIYSTTGVLSQERFGEPFFFVKRQIFAAAIGFAAMLIFSRLNLEFLYKVSPFLLPLSLLLLAFTLISSLGETAGGAQRWINLGLIRFQPGEIAKLLFVIYMAGFLSRRESSLNSFWDGIAKPVFLLVLIGCLYIMQPDFGSAAILSMVVVCMAAVAGARIKYIIFAVLGLAACAVMLIFISPYRLARLMSFMSPWSDSAGHGYQLIQSLIAVGGGGLSGVGIGGSQQKLFFLPAAHTDFIFAVIAEELGFLGAFTILLAFVLLLLRGVRVAGRSIDNTFAFSMAVGLTLLIVIPAFLNLGVVLGLLPTKGLVLPLVAYGGSSLVSSLIAVGLLLAVARSSNSALKSDARLTRF